MASRADAWQRRIRRRLADPPPADARALLCRRIVGPASPELDARLAEPARAAAVLIGLMERGGGPGLLLTHRAWHLPYHPGQIALPGGRLMANESPEAAALREAGEEVGLAAGQVELLGRLPAQLTGTGFEVTPVVGWLDPGFEPVPDPAEVQSVFEVPIGHLLAAGNRQRRIQVRWGTRFVSDEFYFEAHRIWGATAAILNHFFEVIDAETI